MQRAESFPKFFEARVTCDLADLFNPSIFLNALRQQTARQLEVTINQLKLVSIWPSVHQGLERLPNNQAITISNMKLEGATFEDGKLMDCQASSPTVSDVPGIQIAWKAVSYFDSYPTRKSSLWLIVAISLSPGIRCVEHGLINASLFLDFKNATPFPTLSIQT